MAAEHLLVYCTCPDLAVAERIAEAVVTEGRAACANIIPGVRSLYMWEGALERTSEVVMVLKTRAEAYGDLEGRIRQLHPYEVPAIVALPLVRGLPAYLAWLTASVQPRQAAATKD